MNYLAINLWILGYLDQGVQKYQEAVDYAEQLSHPYSLTFAHGMAALFHAVRRDPHVALHHSELAFKLAKESGFPFFLALSMIVRGWARSQAGKGSMARKLVENGVEVMQVIGTELGQPFYLSLMAEVGGTDNKQGLELIRSALEKADESQELWFKSAIYWLWGKIGETINLSRDEISNQYWQSIEIASEQEAKSFILRGAVALVKFDAAGEQAQLARHALRETYQWFEENQDDEFLVEAGILIKSAT